MVRKLSKSKLEKFKSKFIEQRDSIARSLSNGDDELDIEGDDVDLAQGTLIHSLKAQLSTRDLARLMKINRALDKISDGTFGICEECSEKITEKRLLAMPECGVCIDCAEYIEKTARQFA